MNIYVAGKFTTYERCRALMDTFTEAGHQITHDWTRTDEFKDGHPVQAAGDNAVTMERWWQQRYAFDDIRGAKEADVLVVYADTELYGALIEVGVALGVGASVIVINPIRHSIFWTLPSVTVVPDAEGAILAVEILQAKRGSYL